MVTEGRVDAGTLRLLADDEITQLVPVPGDKARFKANLANWKEQIQNLQTPEQCPDSTPNVCCASFFLKFYFIR